MWWIYNNNNIPHTLTYTQIHDTHLYKVYKSIIIDTPHIHIIIYTYAYKYRVETYIIDYSINNMSSEQLI